ncbi:MAG: 3-hydroxyisobutyrate dehydrogenase [Actinomycetota bacterium]|jgi:3-hydroxyisobutyrate dehydrogenase|nr:3-hydroxyisobutyrate dehydrogenase [Actinomycetota bacterium]
MSKIAFLGLGSMGTPMATRLVNAGHDVTVWNRTMSRTTPLADAGASVADSPAGAAAGVELAITMLATPEALDDVLFGSDGLASALSSGQTLVDMSTVGPDAFRAAAARLPSGVAAVDAPVRGSVPEATDGRLQVFVGADDDDFDRVRPVLEVFGEVHHVGAAGAGAAMKLVVNTTLSASIVAVGEALALGQALGLDQGPVLDVLEESPLGPTVKGKRANIEAGHYPPSFKLRLAAKDMRLALDTAANRGIDLRTATTVRRWLDEAAAEGGADLDFSAVVATILDQPARP